MSIIILSQKYLEGIFIRSGTNVHCDSLMHWLEYDVDRQYKNCYLTSWCRNITTSRGTNHNLHYWLLLLILILLIHLLCSFLRKKSQPWPFRIKAQTLKTWCGSYRKGGGGLGTAVCNHASTFSSIHRGIQATQTAINMHQIRDSLYVCVGTNGPWAERTGTDSGQYIFLFL